MTIYLELGPSNLVEITVYNSYINSDGLSTRFSNCVTEQLSRTWHALINIISTAVVTAHKGAHREGWWHLKSTM